jgi:hypothetical protein
MLNYSGRSNVHSNSPVLFNPDGSGWREASMLSNSSNTARVLLDDRTVTAHSSRIQPLPLPETIPMTESDDTTPSPVRSPQPAPRRSQRVSKPPDRLAYS